MGMFDVFSHANLRGPDYNQGNNTQQLLSTVLPYRQSQENDQRRFQTDLMNLQSNLRMKELGQSIRMQQDAAERQAAMDKANPKNVTYDPGLNDWQQAQLGLANRRISATEANNKQKNDINQQNADTKTKLAGDPNFVQIKSKGGTAQYMDKRTGQVYDTGVPEGTMTDSDTLSTKEANAEKLAGVRQGYTATNIGTRGGQALDQIRAAGEEARKTKATPSPNTNANNPTQVKVATQIRANQFMNEHPELAQFVTQDPNTGMITVTPPSAGGMFSSAPTQQQWEQIMDTIYPGTNTSTTAVAPAPPIKSSVPNTFTNTTAPAGKVRVKLPDGRIGYIPAEKANQPGITIINQDTGGGVQ